MTIGRYLNFKTLMFGKQILGSSHERRFLPRALDSAPPPLVLSDFPIRWGCVVIGCRTGVKRTYVGMQHLSKCCEKTSRFYFSPEMQVLAGFSGLWSLGSLRMYVNISFPKMVLKIAKLC